MKPDNFIKLLTTVVDEDTVVSEIKACIREKARDKTLLFSYLKPYLEHWTYVIESKGLDENISTIIFLLSGYTDSPSDLYLSWIQNSKPIRQELDYILITMLDDLSYLKNREEESYSLKMFNYLFLHRVKRNILKQKYIKPKERFSPEVYQLHSDYLLIKNIGITYWEQYLISLLEEGYTYKEIQEITDLDKKTLTTEVRNICQKAQQLYLIDKEYLTKREVLMA